MYFRNLRRANGKGFLVCSSPGPSLIGMRYSNCIPSTIVSPINSPTNIRSFTCFARTPGHKHSTPITCIALIDPVPKTGTSVPQRGIIGGNISPRNRSMMGSLRDFRGLHEMSEPSGVQKTCSAGCLRPSLMKIMAGMALLPEQQTRSGTTRIDLSLKFADTLCSEMEQFGSLNSDLATSCSSAANETPGPSAANEKTETMTLTGTELRSALL